MSPKLLDVLVEQGVFSNIGRLRSEGVYAGLESTYPPNTVPAWPSFATGVNPDKHGIFDWLRPTGSFGNLKPVTSQTLEVKTFYELLDGHGKKTILVNLPVSWPPLTKNPTLTSLLTHSDDLVYPPELADEFPVMKDYRILPDKSPKHEEEYVSDIRALEKTRFECALALLEREWDCFFLMFSGTDWLCHNAFHRLVKNDRTEVMMELFRDIDSYIGELLEKIDGNLNVLVMSDHGFCVRERLFNINVWLEKEGYLATTTADALSMARSPFAGKHDKAEKRRIFAGERRLKWYQRIPVLSRLQARARALLRKKRKRQKEIDPGKTAACSTTNGLLGIYLNTSDKFTDGTVAPENYEKVRDEIIGKLQSQKDPETGGKIFTNVWKKEEIRTGEFLQYAPDICLEMEPGYGLPVTLIDTEVFRKNVTSGHDKIGVFLAWGADVKQDEELPGAHITDLTPTILHSLGCPVPDNLDGRVLSEIFREDSSLAKSQVRYAKAEKSEREDQTDAEQKIIDRLKTLGYME